MWNCLSINLRSSLYHLDSLTRAFTASTCNSGWRSQMRLTLKEQSECGMLCPGWEKRHGMLCPGWQKRHGMLCPGWQKQHGMFCLRWQIFVGCFVQDVIKWHGMFCPGMFCLASVIVGSLLTKFSGSMCEFRHNYAIFGNFCLYLNKWNGIWYQNLGLIIMLSGEKVMTILGCFLQKFGPWAFGDLGQRSTVILYP